MVDFNVSGVGPNDNTPPAKQRGNKKRSNSKGPSLFFKIFGNKPLARTVATVQEHNNETAKTIDIEQQKTEIEKLHNKVLKDLEKAQKRTENEPDEIDKEISADIEKQLEEKEKELREKERQDMKNNINFGLN